VFRIPALLAPIQLTTSNVDRINFSGQLVKDEWAPFFDPNKDGAVQVAFRRLS